MVCVAAAPEDIQVGKGRLYIILRKDENKAGSVVTEDF
jgi:hypothetical protein